jgi:hypothetical protein
MRRAVLILLALALLCQGAWARLDGRSRYPCYCGVATSVPADTVHHAIAEAASNDVMQAHCDATAGGCDDSGCHCQGPGLTGLLTALPALPVAGPGVIGGGVHLRQVPEPVPEQPLRPPHQSAA